MASEIKVDTIVNAGGDNDSGIDLATNDNIKFNIAGSQKAIIDSSGNITTANAGIITAGRFINGTSSNDPWLKGVNSSGTETFFVKPDGTLHTDGNILVGKSSTGAGTAGSEVKPEGGVFTADNDVPLVLNRNSTDGGIVSIKQANSQEGTISVSGSTVSYNGFSGLHESSGIATDTPVGTVVSTIDELDVYSAKQGESEEDNPKSGKARADHAKVKISDTAGDKAVYGVVGSFNIQGKVNVASVGIGSVRVTGACAKGDLLESNGDGTAKVQSDDIVRSKTIGKVTIGNSNTGVKLVSCVLYCG